ncbi:MAG: AraC family transcriptional regulator [Lachnospiraceae bacterium]|nr:AraC family transcriptional regulator [Lachnospiraceae bacterium]
MFVPKERAASLIKASPSETYLKEIAYQVGIEDQLYFSRIFKKYYGMPPSEYKTGG